jgi:hypothetical protein
VKRARRCNPPLLDEQKRARACGALATTKRTLHSVDFDACDACAAAVDAGMHPRRLGGHLDWKHRDAVDSWLDALRESFEDLDAVASDMLRPPRKRELGPALHAEHYAAVRVQILTAIAFAEGPRPGGGTKPKKRAT